MQELINQLIEKGLTPQQAEATMNTFALWLEEEYPVAAVVLKSWIKNQSST